MGKLIFVSSNSILYQFLAKAAHSTLQRKTAMKTENVVNSLVKYFYVSCKEGECSRQPLATPHEPFLSFKLAIDPEQSIITVP